MIANERTIQLDGVTTSFNGDEIRKQSFDSQFKTPFRNTKLEVEVSILRRVEAGFSNRQLDANFNKRMRLEGFNLIQTTFIKKKHTEYY